MMSFIVLTAVLVAQAQPQPTGRPEDPGAPDAMFRTGVTLMTTVVVPRDRSGLFLADLTAEDFLVFEDDGPRPVVSLVPVVGGRTGSQLAPPTQLPGGVILPPPPPPRPAGETGGRLVVILVDDLNIEEGLTLRTRAVFEQLTQNLIREGDLFGVVSTGQSSITIDVTDDRGLLDEAAARIMGGGFNPNELVENFRPEPQGVRELMVRARMAFNTMWGAPSFLGHGLGGESDVTRRWGYGSVEAGEGSWVGADGGSPEGDRSRHRRGGDGVGGLGSRPAVEREPETGRGVAAALRRAARRGFA